MDNRFYFAAQQDPVVFVVHINESPSTKAEQGHIHSLLSIVRDIFPPLEMISETDILFIISVFLISSFSFAISSSIASTPYEYL
jgi:hypothetical protein